METEALEWSCRIVCSTRCDISCSMFIQIRLGSPFSIGNRRFHCYVCYSPTPWDDDEAVGVLLNMLLHTCIIPVRFHRLVVISKRTHELPTLNMIWMFSRHLGYEIGMFTRWVQSHGVLVMDPLRPETCKHDNWTCQSCADGTVVQINFVTGGSHCIFLFVSAWNDNCLDLIIGVSTMFFFNSICENEM